MYLYKFGKQVGWRMAVTTVEDGSNLPKEDRPWVRFGAVEVDKDDGPRVGAGSAEIVAGVEKDGYFIIGGQ